MKTGKQEQNRRKIRILQAQLDKMKEKHRQILYVLQKAEQYLSGEQGTTVKQLTPIRQAPMA